jgi:hypothetical protein
VLYGVRRVGEEVFFGLVHQNSQLREAAAKAVRHPPPLLTRTRHAGLGEAGADGGTSQLILQYSLGIKRLRHDVYFVAAVNHFDFRPR